jgi:tRNA pseudouridine55 synthase
MTPPIDSGVEGLLVVDKPIGPTSHDVVRGFRKRFGTRRVGHSGTLDPNADGLLLLGFGRATRLLGHLTGADKTYTATIRLGISTTTDDAAGDVVTSGGASGFTTVELEAAVAAFRGEIMQRPSSVSAVHVDGTRAHKLVRAGEEVDLPERPVTVSTFDVAGSRQNMLDRVPVVDVEVEVNVSSGTYVRALARDLGEALGVGGHVIALRRTRVGQFDIDEAVAPDAGDALERLIPLPAAVDRIFPRIDVDAADAHRVRHGIRLAAPEDQALATFGIFGPGDELLGLGEQKSGQLAYLVVFAARDAR